ncbi:hypothetical protein [Nostoc sp. UIC 10630]|uniref:hypothetical protein n=1 Tax=Nostoc sp. UIC 10630 TaxID=2100146 RepID=UPI0013D75110|nr:hypothetical protein [Nostoc sp. UIC 10630]NEU83787.1 hypothetical protein [Nostoc sp. UIC 10630]
MFLTIGKSTININHICSITWTTNININVVEASNDNTNENPPSKNPIINWLEKNLKEEKKPDSVYIFLNHSISSDTGSQTARSHTAYMCFSWEDYEEDLKALARTVNFDLTRIGR